MATYTRIPQFEHVELQRAVPSGDNDDDGRNMTTIRSITISNETRADGSIIRRKETLFTNGKTVVEEKELSRPLLQDAGIRYLPISPIHLTPATTDIILPLYHRHPRPLTTKESSGTHDRQRLVCQFAAGLVALLILFQIVLWYEILSGQSIAIPSFFVDILRQFQSKP